MLQLLDVYLSHLVVEEDSSTPDCFLHSFEIEIDVFSWSRIERFS